MVDVVRAVGNAEQLRAIAELRWRMLVNTGSSACSRSAGRARWCWDSWRSWA